MAEGQSPEEVLADLLARLSAPFAKFGGIRSWVGPTPDERDQLPFRLVGEIGYDTSTPPRGEFVAVGRTRAAEILFVIATQPLASGFVGRQRSAPNQVAEVERRLSVLDEGAQFFATHDPLSADYDWKPVDPTPESGGVDFHRAFSAGLQISDATFECGVIGFDDQTAFVFWREEED